jgi:hypothetical protein
MTSEWLVKIIPRYEANDAINFSAAPRYSLN